MNMVEHNFILGFSIALTSQIFHKIFLLDLKFEISHCVSVLYAEYFCLYMRRRKKKLDILTANKTKYV